MVTIRALSLALAATTLAGALWYSRSLWIYGPTLVCPFFGAPFVAGMAVLRAIVVRKLGGPDAAARALEIIALGVMLASGAGVIILLSSSAMKKDCGLLNASAVRTALHGSWAFWSTGEVGVLVALGCRGAGLARLRWYQAPATILTLIAAPPLAVLACLAMELENDHGGGAATMVLLPAALAAGSTVVAWTWGRSFATGTALRRVGAAALVLGAGLSAALPARALLASTCVSFLSTVTWGLLADVGWAVAPCLAVLLLCARDPISPATGVRG